ncbi:hypothetical protein MTZ49_10775 [Entomomonas sp. E2T0]|uniref:hypothetical protein n=1 Tax=Entomomonas sp. E2T0 TaxID=2930213 RepID=UPI002228163F|nr:hypothetical protein [Entomomonas sp. E2T0]UYZ83085.1 hypothetical protein MTZ49_10775 [Entomomonas sp. E2T0]
MDKGVKKLGEIKFKFSHLYIIDMLGGEDKIIELPQEAVEDCKDRINTAELLLKNLTGNNGSFTLKYCKIHNKPMLENLLEKINENVKKEGEFPILHFECHGHKSNLGLMISSTNKLVKWDELIPYFIDINKYTKNNFGVVLASCNGLGILESVEIPMGSPFGFLIATDKEVADIYIKQFMDFYNILFYTNDISRAMESIASEFKSFISQQLCIIFMSHLLYSLKERKSRNDFKEYLTSELKDNLSSSNLTPIKTIRNDAKNKIKNMKYYYELSAKRFLHGAEPYPYEEVDELFQQLKNDREVQIILKSRKEKKK